MTESTSMNIGQIKTQKDFCDFIRVLAKDASSSNRSLEDYLRALWLLVQKHKNDKLSFVLLAQMLNDALTAPVAPFDDDWLNYEKPPSELSQNHPVENDFEFLKKMILYQIADLHRMREEGALDAPPHILWLGASRKGGSTWYNFEPATFLSIALGGIKTDSDNTEYDWSNLAIQLWLGQIYE
jgi:hypothetical protein